MATESLILEGAHVRLEPLTHSHARPLLAAAADDPALYRWTPVPQTMPEAERYIDTALASREAGCAVPFVTVRRADNAVIGSTRFWNLENWAWPSNHAEAGRRVFDVCEIGHTWLAASAIRTAINTEAKLLMLTHAFETWNVHRVSFHTDARNQRSRAAIERIGGRFEGVLRAQRMGADFTVRDSARFSIVAAEWPEVKEQLQRRLNQA